MGGVTRNPRWIHHSLSSVTNIKWWIALGLSVDFYEYWLCNPNTIRPPYSLVVAYGDVLNKHLYFRGNRKIRLKSQRKFETSSWRLIPWQGSSRDYVIFIEIFDITSTHGTSIKSCEPRVARGKLQILWSMMNGLCKQNASYYKI